MPLARRLALALLPLPLTLVLAGCNGRAETAAPAAPPPVEVGVVTVAPQAIGIVTELPGRLEASRVAQVRARAAGILVKRLFREGSDVKAGQPLFQIDPAPYRAALESAQASLARAEANLAQATSQAERYQPLLEANAVSKQDYVNAVAQQKQAQADVAAGKAAVQTARINLGYAAVTAPIAGRIGRALVTEGALVGQGEATQLALIQQIDPVYINFTQPASEALRLRQAFESGKLQRAAGPQAAKVSVLLDDGSTYGQAGRLLFSDLSVDPTSGQVSLRAELPNPQGLLLPGLYVRVRIEQAQASQAVLLPQQAVSRSAQADTVLVVGADAKVAPRPVKLGGAQGNQWLVLEGLKNGEQVVVEGFQKLKPDATVKPVAWQGGAGAPAAGAASAPASAPPAAAPAASAAASAPRRAALPDPEPMRVPGPAGTGSAPER